MEKECIQTDWLPGERLIVFSVLVSFLIITLSSAVIVFTVWGPM